MGVDQLRQVCDLVDAARGYEERDLAGHFEDRLTECQAQDGSQGPARVLPSALGVVAALEVTARRVSLPARAELLRIAARAAEFIGWLYRDAALPEQATYWRDRATEWAQEARRLQGTPAQKTSRPGTARWPAGC